MEPYKDNDNYVNYQDLDVSQEKDEICVAGLHPRPPYTCQMLKVDENKNCLTQNIVLTLLRQIKYLMYF